MKSPVNVNNQSPTFREMQKKSRPNIGRLGLSSALLFGRSRPLRRLPSEPPAGTIVYFDLTLVSVECWYVFHTVPSSEYSPTQVSRSEPNPFSVPRIL